MRVWQGGRHRRWYASLVGLLEGAERVGAQAEPQCLEPDDRVRGYVAEVHVRAEPGDEVCLQGRGGGLEEQLPLVDSGRQDVLDQPEPERAVRPADPGPPALPFLQGEQRRASLDVLVDVADSR